MTDEKLKQEIKNAMPETPFGYETRVDAQVEQLQKNGGRRAVFGLNRRAVLALALVAVLGLSGVIGYAVNAPVPGHRTISPRLDYSERYADTVWYTDNTASLAGLPLRDIYPGLTDKWYNVVPVDLTQKGRQTYTLVGSNMYYLGEVYVDVTGTDVTVSYGTYRGQLTVKSECLQWFVDPADITSEFVENPQGGYEFGQAVSIQNDLQGAEIGLLFICNQVSYCNPYSDGYSLVRYWPNLTEWKEFRTSLEPLMDRLEAQAERLKTLATPTDQEGETEAENGEK